MAFRDNPPTLPLDQLVWDETGDESDPKARLLTHIRIGSLDMHLEAWEVEIDNDIQVATSASLSADDFDMLCAMMDTAFSTVEIDGRNYVLIATPYGA